MYQRWGLKLVAVAMLAMTIFLLVKMKEVNTQDAEVILPQSEEPVSMDAVPGGRDLCIVIDAGHGGRDGGKVGSNGVLEKDINLQMAYILRDYLEAAGYTVVMTRETDAGLYDEDAPNRKMQDLQRRVELIADVAPDMVISIHQNSYTDESVRGAQVFYYAENPEGELLAECIQLRLNEASGGENPRQTKGNTDYYLLKKTEALTVIVECGFLSCYEEAELLANPEYQDKMMQAVMEGVEDYFTRN